MTHPHIQLAEWLKSNGEIHAQFAKRLGVTKSLMSHILAGRRRPGRRLAVQIAKETGLPISAWGHRAFAANVGVAIIEACMFNQRLSPRSLAHKAGVSHHTVGKTLNGRTIPTPETIALLNKALGLKGDMKITIDDFRPEPQAVAA